MNINNVEVEINHLVVTRDLKESQLDDLIEMMNLSKNHILSEHQLQLSNHESSAFFSMIEDRYLSVIRDINVINDKLEELGFDVRGNNSSSTWSFNNTKLVLA